MSEKVKNTVTVCAAAAFLLVFFVWSLIKPADDISESERRKLAAFPKISVDTVLSGKFTEDFEDYATDQFPMRDGFRELRALSSFYLFRQKDKSGIYLGDDGYISKTEYPVDTGSLDNAAKKLRKLYDKYLKDSNTNVYFSIIPDKNYFMADKNGNLSMDYSEFVNYLKSKTEYMHYIDIFDRLELSDYYKTDTHWRQEKITDVAQKIAEEMGADVSADYTENLLDKPFYGVYYGQAALSLPGEKLYYLNNATLDACTVYDYETDKQGTVYDMEKAYGKDPYEMFLSGSKSLLTVKNPNAATDKRLIIFRDSFGSSIAPLLVQGYSEVTLADIRYISPETLGRLTDFKDSDVLFLYSTLVLNNSITFK